jgi:hypothetical protein
LFQWRLTVYGTYRKAGKTMWRRQWWVCLGEFEFEGTVMWGSGEKVGAYPSMYSWHWRSPYHMTSIFSEKNKLLLDMSLGILEVGGETQNWETPSVLPSGRWQFSWEHRWGADRHDEG